MSHRFKDARAL